MIGPRNLTLAIGFFTTFPLFLVMMLSAKDLDAVANAPLPYAELLYQITGSRPITSFVIVWVTIVLFSMFFIHSIMPNSDL